MRLSALKEEMLNEAVIDRLLYCGMEDSRAEADCIMVLGSLKASKYRVPVAAEAYRSGRSKKIILCGGKLRDFADGTRSEAEDMRLTALRLGVRDEDIILENSSQNTAQNIDYAYKLLLRYFEKDKIRSILLVTTNYHMRRSLQIARSILPARITVIPCVANDTNTRRDNWMKSEAGISRARGEALKIIRYVNEGLIPDFEI